jgi:hypothetical protein
MISRPVISPHAPAGGCSVARVIPVISHSAASSRQRSSRVPWIVSAGCSGCNREKPGNPAAVSATLGLYFIEQDPRG